MKKLTNIEVFFNFAVNITFYSTQKTETKIIKTRLDRNHFDALQNLFHQNCIGTSRMPLYIYLTHASNTQQAYVRNLHFSHIWDFNQPKICFVATDVLPV